MTSLQTNIYDAYFVLVVRIYHVVNSPVALLRRTYTHVDRSVPGEQHKDPIKERSIESFKWLTRVTVAVLVLLWPYSCYCGRARVTVAVPQCLAAGAWERQRITSLGETSCGLDRRRRGGCSTRLLGAGDALRIGARVTS